MSRLWGWGLVQILHSSRLRKTEPPEKDDLGRGPEQTHVSILSLVTSCHPVPSSGFRSFALLAASALVLSAGLSLIIPVWLRLAESHTR